MKNIFKIILSFFIIFSFFGFGITEAKINGLEEVSGIKDIEKTSVTIQDKGDVSQNVESLAYRIYGIAKFIFSGILLLFLVYSGAQMIMSMGTDEDSLSSSKRNIRYTLIGLLFVNIPGTLYEAFRHSNKGVGGGTGNWDISNPSANIFINFGEFKNTLNESIIGFIEIMMVAVGIMVIALAGIKIMMSTGDEGKLKEAKDKIVWSIIGLIFVGFIEAWQNFAYGGKIEDGKNIFEALANLALFMAGPVAIFFLTLAGYYFITSAGDDEKITKAKTIIINTVIGTVIILCSYLFLNDISTLLK